jgi:DinB superfamily
MDIDELLIDAFGRIREETHAVLDGASPAILTHRPDPGANSIAWLIWHLTRIQDDHVADVAGVEQRWIADGWYERFALPFPPEAHGYGHTSEEVGQVRTDGALLRGYFDAVDAATVRYLRELRGGDLDRIVDERWDPPVSLGVRLVSVVADDLQHVGQAAYVRGVAERRGVS